MIERATLVFEHTRETDERTHFIAEDVINARINLIAPVDVCPRRNEVVLLRVDVARRGVGLRPVFHQIACDGALPVGADDVGNAVA